ncbi:hypothetical protein BDL97_05G075700 [Sphagnum fallax]|nr:hypothetical protein BDL97_05G075700 [Sphagnum fallax]
MVILGQHLIGGLWLHKLSSPFRYSQTTPSFLQHENFVSVVLRVRKGRVFKGQLMPKRTILPSPILQAPNFAASFMCYLLTAVLKRAACDVCEYTFQQEHIYILPQACFMEHCI